MFENKGTQFHQDQSWWTLCSVARQLAQTNNSVNVHFRPQIVTILLAKCSNLSVSQLLAQKQIVHLTEQQYFWIKFEQYLLGRPLPYLLQSVNINQQAFYLDERTFIPRDETISLLNQLVLFLQQQASALAVKSVIVWGVGCGWEVVYLAQKFPQAHLMGVDISPWALSVAHHNQQKYQLNNVELRRDNFLTTDLRKYQDYQIIVMNPPYVSVEWWNNHSNLWFEPKTALVPSEHVLIFYQRMLTYLNLLTHTTFMVLLEIGFQQQKTILKLFRQSFTANELTFWFDEAGHARGLFIHRKDNC